MLAKSLQELEKMMKKEMRKAMNVASEKILADMYDETGKYYTKGTPVMYKRTGALGDTPKTAALTESGNTMSFKAYLDTSGGYTTGSKPTMTQVLNLANSDIKFTTKNGYLANSTLGRKGFWERAENKMEETLKSTMKQFFK